MWVLHVVDVGEKEGGVGYRCGYGPRARLPGITLEYSNGHVHPLLHLLRRSNRGARTIRQTGGKVEAAGGFEARGWLAGRQATKRL